MIAGSHGWFAFISPSVLQQALGGVYLKQWEARRSGAETACKICY